MKPNESCQLVEVIHVFASKGDKVKMSSRKNNVIDTILGAKFLHIPVSVVLGRCFHFQKLKRRWCPNGFTSSVKAVQTYREVYFLRVRTKYKTTFGERSSKYVLYS